MKFVRKITLNPSGTVTLFVVERWGRYGPIRDSRRLTFERRDFERALRQAEVTVPWDQAATS